jgi:hypothetical protein
MRAIAALLALSLLPSTALADRKDRDEKRSRPAPAQAERQDRGQHRGEARTGPHGRGDRGEAHPGPRGRGDHGEAHPGPRGRGDHGEAHPGPRGRGDHGEAHPAPRGRGDGWRARPAPAAGRGERDAIPARRGQRSDAQAVPAPAPGTPPSRYAYAPYVESRPYYQPYHSSFWLGSGWGWGYYPMYPRPHYAPDEAREEAERIATRLSFAAGGAPDAAFAGVNLALDGRHAGFHLGIDAVALDRGFDGEDDDALGWGSAHLTWSVAASQAFRVRAELGLSMLSIPGRGSYAGRSYADTVAFGPDVGVSAQVGLVGPIGLEGHARLTPFPVPVSDLRLALALRGGPFALTAGVRNIEVMGDEEDGPEGRFAGPELGLSLVF